MTDAEAEAGLAEVVGRRRNAEQVLAALVGLYRLRRGEGAGVEDAFEVVLTELLERTAPLPAGWVEYRPAFAPHVRGSYSPRAFDPELGAHEPQTVRARCEACSEEYGPAECRSGRVRQHVDAWAAAGHLHRDRMEPRPVLKPAGS